MLGIHINEKVMIFSLLNNRKNLFSGSPLNNNLSKHNELHLMARLTIVALLLSFLVSSCCTSETIVAPTKPTYIEPTK